MLKKIISILLISATTFCGTSWADGIVSTIVNAPLSATGTVKGSRVGINVYLQNEQTSGIDFMNPAVTGYGIPAGGVLEVEMAEGFERNWDVALSQSAIMMVTGAPQQGLPGAKVGYEVGEGDDENTFVIKPQDDKGLVAEDLKSPAPGSAADPVQNKGIKVIHIGFMQSAFLNTKDKGTVKIRIKDGNGNVVSSGSGSVEFLEQPVAQILPTNFPQKVRNHNWQTIKSGDTLGQTENTLPLTFMVFDQAPQGDIESMYAYKSGMEGIGVLSTPQLKALGFEKPTSMARYNGGLVLQDSDSDGVLDPNKDKIIGGVLANAPAGAKGQELRSLEKDGRPVLSVLTEKMAPKPGKRWGGSMLMLQFTSGSEKGLYRPTVALLKDPSDPSAGDGSSFTYTIQVK